MKAERGKPVPLRTPFSQDTGSKWFQWIRSTINGNLAHVLTDAPKEAVLVLRGIDGREVKRMPISTRQGQQLVDTRGYAPGTYSVELINDGARLATQRLVVKP